MKKKGKVQKSYIRLMFNSDELNMICDALLTKQLKGEYKDKQYASASSIIFRCNNALKVLAYEHIGLTEEMN